MRTDLTPEQIIANAVTIGKALVRLLEVCNIVLEQNRVWTEQLLLRLMRALLTHRFAIKGILEN